MEKPLQEGSVLLFKPHTYLGSSYRDKKYTMVLFVSNPSLSL